jgi:hypothetical protein
MKFFAFSPSFISIALQISLCSFNIISRAFGDLVSTNFHLDQAVAQSLKFFIESPKVLFTVWLSLAVMYGGDSTKRTKKFVFERFSMEALKPV